ncbi:amidohydrolase [Hymenobacter sp. DH14]|uniref:Omega-amidase YafV n=1 Tax=Hymenobacter cyanobacteriorum TaxID=2926463 RepID=A0A9X2AFD7_9BACT|nr:amidohydrolase [Hymenobacter cyanobacteriorum]MCI1187762.1 amidohydrolase [Hymenobacter cyanobacteriorum]
MPDITVSFVQTALHWHDAAANRAHFDQLLASLAQPTDLIVLPEMFSTGFSMDAAGQAETMQGATVAWLRDTAARHNAVVTGSVIIEDHGHYYNRLLWARPDGGLSWYNKRHLFTLAGEQRTYTPGTTRLIEHWRGWRICPLVCYDLRFPVWSRNQPVEPYDLVLYVANWPAVRRTAWMTLLRARAIENVACALGVNRVGRDGSGHEYSGDSALLDAQGNYLVEAESRDGVFTHTLRLEDLEVFRARFGALNDGDAFELRG